MHKFQKFIEDTCRYRMDRKEITHASVMVGFIDEVEPVYSLELGLTSQNRFDLSSLTKALATTPLVYKDLYESSQPTRSSLSDWLGHASGTLSEGILSLDIESVLSHSSGLPDWLSLWTQCLDGKTKRPSRDQVRERINHCLTSGNSGNYRYSDIGFILLGLGLEVKHGLSLPILFRNLLVEDLKLPGSTLNFNSSHESFESSISTGFSDVRGIKLLGQVHDENAAYLGGKAGHAGLFGSSWDVWSFIRSLSHRPWGKRLIEENAARRTNERKMLGLSGWHQGCGDSSRTFAGGNGIGHLGFTGTAFWYEPETNKVSIILTNRVISQRLSPWITNFRAEILGALNEISKRA